MKKGSWLSGEDNSGGREPWARSISRVPRWDNDLEEGTGEQATMCYKEALGGGFVVR